MSNIENANRNFNPIMAIQLAQHSYNTYSVTVPAFVGDIEDSKYWVHVAGRLSEGDEIRVLSEDYSMYVRLLVAFRAGTTVKMVVLEKVEPEKVAYEDAAEGAFFVKLRGPKKWCIIRRSDGDVVKEMIPTQALAYKELEDLQKALAA